MTEPGRSVGSITRLPLVVAAVVVTIAACGESVTQIGVDDIVELRLSLDSTIVATGFTVQIRALPLDSTGALLVAQEVAWSSSDPAIASVDDTGLVTGVSLGTAEVTAAIAGLEARAVITVLPPPRIVLSADTVMFTATAGGADPAADSVLVTNGSPFPVLGLAIDSITYGGGAQDWLVAQLASTAPPTRLDLGPMVTGVTVAGDYVATVWLFGIDAENSPAPVVVTLEIVPGPAAAIEVFDGDGQTGPVDTALPTAPAVRVTDGFGNGVSGAQVTFAVVTGGGAVAGATATSDASGIARVGSWTLGTSTGTNSLSATLAGAPPVNFTAVATAGAPSTLELSAGDGQTAIAGSAVSVAPAVIVRDGFGNPADGIDVAFDVTSGGGSVTGSPASSGTDGTATVGSWVLGPTVGANSLIATVPGVPDTISFTATGVTGPAASMALDAGNAQTDTIGATLATPYSVRVSDANGNPVTGVTVTWAVTGGGGSIGTLSTTAASGIATATHTFGTVAGAQTAEASVSGLTGSPVAFSSTALAGAPTSVSIANGDAQTATVGTAVPVSPSVLVVDGSGNPAGGVQVTFAVTGGGGSVTGATPTSDASGIAQVGSWTLGTAAGANQMSASVTGMTPVVFTATGVAGAATQLQLDAGDNQSAVAGTAVTTPPSVAALDQFGNGVPGVPVVFQVTSGGGSVTAPTPTSGAGGIAAVGSWTLGVTAGANTLQATSAGIADSITFTATALGGAPVLMSLDGGDAQTDTVAATLATPYSVLIVDTNMNGVSGIPVSWTVTGGGGSITVSSMTGIDGVASATRVLGTVAGVQTATASVGGLAGSPVSFTATATTGAPSIASIDDGQGEVATVGTAVATAPSIQVTDQFGNAISGLGVTFAVTVNNGSVGGGAQVTDGGGIATVGSWTLGTVAGANELSATPTGLAAVTFSATGTPDVEAQLVLFDGDNQNAVAGSPVAVQPAVRVLDQFDNEVQGVTATFEVASGGGSITGASPVSASNGVATLGSWTLGGTVGANTLRATVVGVVDTVTFTATGLVGAAALMSLDDGDNQIDTVGATLPTAYSVLIEDANGNPVSGTTVTWAVTNGTGGSITSSSVTDASGIAVATRVLGTVAQNQTASGSVGGLTGSPVDFTATATAGAPVTISASAGGGESATVNTPVPTPPAVLVVDQFSNPVPGESVTFSVTGGGGAVDPVTALMTGAAGTATVTSWTLGTSAGTNNNTLVATAASGGIAGNPVTFTSSATAGAPANIVRTPSGDSQTAITGLNVANPPTVTVTDAFANPVGGATVNFTPSGSGSVGTPSASTNPSGVAMTTWAVNAVGAVDTLQADGTYPNTLTATVVEGTAPSTQFAGFAIYSFQTHVNPIVGSGSCTGCHGTSGMLSLSGSAAANYTSLVTNSLFCDDAGGGLGAQYRRVSQVGGIQGEEDFSVIMRLIDPSGLGDIGTCGPHSKPLSAGQVEIIQAWIRNTAPNN